MIDVPVSVKEALKDGRKLKNHRFFVYPSGRQAGYYEIFSLVQDQQATIPANGTYRIYADAANAYSGITTWIDGEEAEWLTPDTVTPDTSFTGYFEAGDVISVTGFDGIASVSVQTWLNEDQEEFVIDNDTLVSESVKYDERMCSGDTLKFGLCEGSSLEFQYFNYPSIYGKEVKGIIDVQYMESYANDPGPNDIVKDKWAVETVFKTTKKYIIKEDGSYKLFIPASSKGYAESFSIKYFHGGMITTQGMYPWNQDRYFDFNGDLDAGDEVWIEGPLGFKFTMYAKKYEYWYSIPMGYFTVEKCSRQASTGIKKVTAYNKLQSDYLDEKANEAIVEIASEGEEGESTVSFYYILKKLLDQFSIETYDPTNESIDITDSMLDDDSLFQYWLSQHAAGVSEIIFPLYNSSGTMTSTYLHIAVFSWVTGVATDNYLRLLFNKNVAMNIKESIYKANINPNLDNRYIRDYDDSSHFVSLRDFLLNGVYATVKALTSPAQYSLAAQKEMVGGLISAYGESTDLISLTEDYLTKIHLEPEGIKLPYLAIINNSNSNVSTQNDYITYFRPLHHTFSWFYKTYLMDLSPIEKMRITAAEAENFADITLRDLQTAVYETSCQFGRLDRVTDLFSGTELNNSRLYPATTLYPDTALYPDGAALSSEKNMYSKLWADEGNVQKWRYLIITYKGLDENQQEKDFTLQRTIHADGTQDYNMSDNWIFRNLIWTAQEVGEYADAMVQKMQSVTWFPFEMWCAGLPYLETGDEIEISMGEETYKTYVLQRQLNGIQNLQDTYINGTLDIF